MLIFTKTVFDYHFCKIVTVSERAEKFTLQHSDKIQPRCECNKNTSFFFCKELYTYIYIYICNIVTEISFIIIKK